jgi:hypothetical protein
MSFRRTAKLVSGIVRKQVLQVLQVLLIPIAANHIWYYYDIIWSYGNSKLIRGKFVEVSPTTQWYESKLTIRDKSRSNSIPAWSMNKVCRFRMTVCKHFWAHLRLQKFVWVWAQQQFHYHPRHETKWGSNLWKASLQQHLLGALVGLHHYLAAMPGAIQINIHQHPSQTSENTVSMRTSASVMMSTVVARSSPAPIRWSISLDVTWCVVRPERLTSPLR